MNDLKEQFPFFINNPDIVYFDNASTTQKPTAVISAINKYLNNYCANAGRGSYTLANKVTKEIEDIREKIKIFINAKSPDEIVFTSGTTASINFITYSWGLHNLKTDDEILVCFEDHDSNVLPWINMKNVLSLAGIQIKIANFKNTSAGDANIQDILSKITGKTRLVVLTHIHNLYGIKTDVEVIRKKINKDVLISLDAAQSAGHIPLNVQDLGVDFLSFSGHKMFASTGTGILFINKRIHNRISPFLVGGGTTIPGRSSQILKDIPYLLEAGTHNILGIISVGAAIDFINKISIEKIHDQLLTLSQYLLDKLRTVPGIEFLPGIAFCRCAVGYGTIAFNINGIPSSDIGFILNENNIFVRAGTHCTGGVSNKNGAVRVSLHIYNTTEEIDKLVRVLKSLN
jgi:cysteine desulfurase / selenocysteine lyase